MPLQSIIDLLTSSVGKNFPGDMGKNGIPMDYDNNIYILSSVICLDLDIIIYHILSSAIYWIDLVSSPVILNTHETFETEFPEGVKELQATWKDSPALISCDQRDIL